MSYGGAFGHPYGGGSYKDPRAIQIANLKRIQGCVEVQPNVLYKVYCHPPSGGFDLMVMLPPGFPNSPPEVKMDRPARHKLVDKRTLLILTPEVTQQYWSPHIDVGNVIDRIRAQLVADPPVFEIVAGGSGGDQGRWDAAAARMPQPQRPAVQPVPGVPASFPQLESMSNEELQKLLNDEGAFTEFLTNLPVYKELENMRTNLATKNVEVASANMAMRGPLEDLKQKLAETHAELGRRKVDYDNLVKQERELAVQFSHGTIERKLKDAMDEAAKAASHMSSQFTAGENTDVDAFCTEFRAKKKLEHMRKIKLDKLKELSR